MQADFMEPQNHRVAEVGQHLWRPSSPATCSEQRKLLRLMPTWVLNISEDRDTTTSLCILCQGLITLIIFFFSLKIKQNFLHFNLSLFPLVTLLDTTEKSLVLSSLIVIYLFCIHIVYLSFYYV